MAFPETLHLFCRVVDNFGDIGFCWRLARQLADEHAIAVTLWVDDLASFKRICAAIDPGSDAQQALGVEVRRWRDELFEAPEPADVVIEAFACELPVPYVAAMAARERKPVWLNLEYLSAEAWVEDCHGMPSRHPSLPLTKYFFFPGFSGKTGGLVAERDLAVRREAFQNDPAAVAGFLARLGVQLPGPAHKVSLFCYPDAPVDDLFLAMQDDAQAVACLVPEGVAADAVGRFLLQPPKVGAHATRGALTVHVVPFVDQPDYDRLLWACDLNFVRAQWAARPFIWHIYPQEENTHWTKLEAFMARYHAGMEGLVHDRLKTAWMAWNGVRAQALDWHSFKPVLPQLSQHASNWAAQLSRNGDLASNLVQYVREIC
jgi:uncharacterized repeat protein (TIGR03837 family)